MKSVMAAKSVSRGYECAKSLYHTGNKYLVNYQKVKINVVLISKCDQTCSWFPALDTGFVRMEHGVNI